MGRKRKIIPGGVINQDDNGLLAAPYLPDMTPKPKPSVRGPYYKEGKKVSKDDILDLE